MVITVYDTMGQYGTVVNIIGHQNHNDRKYDNVSKSSVVRMHRVCARIGHLRTKKIWPVASYKIRQGMEKTT